VKDYMEIATVLTTSMVLSHEDYEEISKIPASFNYKRASKLLHAMYKAIEADKSSVHKIRSVLKEEDMEELVVKWEEYGKCSINYNKMINHNNFFLLTQN